ncbi:flagellar filament capping protein FliD [Comamonas sp. Y6]|uniref:Flagellar hook-associated protein 2 n=1 Tax=Comamonas resistens TaxID=3046670 RepID=A0ABY8SSU2_9BURK|nr:flagellar filament capping protein FliD [Comamonas resistens]MDL5039198.1 flagellar filament capping protein FliD [Comamonas resistens]WHS66023.1 flagellar filament capping protein FliD [Comamonas resistens]
MAGISSIGIGSGLNVSDIISKMVALQKQPLQGLQARQQTIQTQISTYAQIKSLTNTLADANAKLTRDSGWNSMSISSSNPAVSMTVSGIASAATYDVSVTQLARSQTSVSASRDVDQKIGTAGMLTIQGAKTGALPVEVKYNSGDTLTTLAVKINEQAGDMQALVMRDGAGKEQLVLRSKATGNDAKFDVSDTGAVGNFSTPLGQDAQDALIKINGVTQASSTDNFDNVLPGLKITVSQVTVDPVTQADKPARVSVTADKAGTKKNIQDFIDAFNALNDLLSKTTKGMRDENGKTVSATDDKDPSGVFQGDSSTVSLQSSLRSLLGGTASNASGGLKRLADIGIEYKDGSLKITKSDKLDKAMDSPDALKSLFAAKASSDGSGGGIAVGLKKFTDELLAYDGTLNSKSDALELRKKNNLKDQDKVNAGAATLEAKLSRQYSALDSQMASITALNTYMQNQIAAWNKSK